MNFKTRIFLLAILLVTIESALKVERDNEDDKTSIVSLAWKPLLNVMAPIAISHISFYFGQIFSPSHEKGFEFKLTILARLMKVKICEDAERCVTITDEWSGTISTKAGTSFKQAIEVSTKQMYEELLKTDQFSLQDLCDQNIEFYHPDQEKCKDIILNPCDLVQTIVTASKPCDDSLGKYCIVNKERCTLPEFSSFMMDNCYKTCTDGKCGASSDPCSL